MSPALASQRSTRRAVDLVSLDAQPAQLLLVHDITLLRVADYVTPLRRCDVVLAAAIKEATARHPDIAKSRFPIFVKVPQRRWELVYLTPGEPNLHVVIERNSDLRESLGDGGKFAGFWPTMIDDAITAAATHGWE